MFQNADEVQFKQPEASLIAGVPEKVKQYK